MVSVDAFVPTDMGTALWYLGDTDGAISEFKKSFSYDPNKPNTLFNLGVVQRQGKMDIDGAAGSWQKLLDTNPNYEGKNRVLQMIAQAKQHARIKPGATLKPMPQ
jgi:tetratricopeptide (TPR) repeat protein